MQQQHTNSSQINETKTLQHNKVTLLLRTLNVLRVSYLFEVARAKGTQKSQDIKHTRNLHTSQFEKVESDIIYLLAYILASFVKTYILVRSKT